MKKIVIIGAGEFQVPLIVKAKEMGYETHVFAWQEGAVGEKDSDFFYPISITEKEEILEYCKQIKPCAVATIASDLANITVQYLSQRLGLTHNSEECIEISTNKYKMRCALSENGVSCPRFKIVDTNTKIGESEFSFPVIVKPTDRSGSRGITKVENHNQLTSAIKSAADYSFEKRAIIEEFIEGDEYSCECISFNGKHNLLAITKKFTTGAPCFIETGHIEPSLLDAETSKRVMETVFKGLDALKIKFGASHSEFRINSKGEIRIIEIGSRMGGDCIGSHLVRLSSGYDFLSYVIETAAGIEPNINRLSQPSAVGIRFIFTKDDINVLENIKTNSPESLYFVSEIEDVGSRKIVDSGSRFGFFIVTSPDENQLLKLLEF